MTIRPPNLVRRTRSAFWLIAACVAVAGLACTVSFAQQSTPVYVDDSVAARESLARVDDLIATRNLTEAARILQAVLDTESDRVLESPSDPDLFLSVRDIVNRKLLATPALLERYRLAESPRAERQLAAGEIESVERSHLLTTSGFDAALKLARERLLAGRFEAARLALLQLQTHPDRAADRARQAAALAVQLARYLPRPEVRAWAVEWTAAAGQPAPADADLAPAAVPARAARVTRSPMSVQDAPPAWSDDALSKPLVSSLAGTQFETPRDDWEVALADLPQRSEERGNAWMFPTVSGDTVYTNDGVEITAYDRITLSILWRARPPELLYDESSYEERRGRIYRPDYILDDVSTVSVGSGVVVGVSGLAMGSGRRGDPRVHAYSSDGQWLWSVDIESLSPQFESSTVRGEIIIDGDTAIIPIRKRATSRRISSAYLVALDAHTGAMKWTRLLGSAGSLPSPARDRIADSPLLHHGLIIHTDGLGVIAAVESATGRVAWSRRFRGEPVYRSSLVGEFTPVWCVNRPIPDGSTILSIQPGGENLLRFDLASGTVTEKRPLAFVGDPRCAIRVGGYVCFPAMQRMTFIPIDRIETGEAASSIEFAPGTLKGRPIAAGTHLLVPTAAGIATIDPASPKDAGLLNLAPSGNTIVTDGTLLVTDQTRLHLFVDADRATQTLQARAAKYPDAVLPQIELVDLAFRAARYEQILPPADRALALLASLPPDADRELRHRLFTSLSGIVRRALGETSSTPTATAVPARSTGPVGLSTPMNITLVSSIVERLAGCAVTPPEKVEHLLLAARADESRTAGASSIARYQAILADPALAGVTLPGPDYTLTTAAKIATERMYTVVARFGASSYLAQDDQAAAELSKLGAESAAPVDALLTLVNRYPAAAVAPRIWRAVAERRAASGEYAGSIQALADAAHVARIGVTAGRVEQAQFASEAALDLAASLAAQGRPAQALAMLASLDESLHQGPLAPKLAAIRAQVDAALARPPRSAHIGDRPAEGVQVLAGWILIDDFPVLKNSGGPSIEHVVLYNDSLSRIGLFSITPRGSFEKLWDKPYEGIRPTLLRVDHRHVVLFTPTPVGGTVECLDVTRGTQVWKSPDISTWFDAVERKRTEADGPPQVATPLEGMQRPGDILVFGDDKILVLAQRGGRLGALDLATGQRLWAVWPRIDTVFDAAVVSSDQGDTVIAVGRRRGVDRTADPIAALVTLDARTGKILHEVDERTGWFDRRQTPADPGDIRWVRAISGGKVVLGMNAGLACVDPRAGTQIWTIQDPALGQATDGWVLGDALVVLSRERALWLVDLVKGSKRDKALEQRGKLGDNTRIRIDALHSPNGASPGFAVSSERGVLCYDFAGKLIGADALDAESSVLLPALSSDRIVAVASEREELKEPGIPSDASREAARIFTFEAPGLRLTTQPMLVMYDDPRVMTLLDGKLLVSTSSLTLVVSLPSSK